VTGPCARASAGRGGAPPADIDEAVTGVDTDRLEAFFDGVLAVAITLLVLGLHVPVPGRGSLANQLGREWPAFAAYLVSFFVIGIIWVNHHAVLHNIARVDRLAMSVNLLLLMFVTAIPFSTASLAGYLRHGGRDDHLAAAIYGVPVLGVALSFTALCTWAARRGLLHARLGYRGAATSVRRFDAGSVAIMGAIAVTFLSAIAALATHATIAAYYSVERSPADGDR
jgi:uncharacterized membrane protein